MRCLAAVLGPDLYQTIHLFHAPSHTVSCHQYHFFLSLFYLFAALLSFLLRKRLPLHSRLYRAFILLLSFTCSASFIERLPIVLVALQLYLSTKKLHCSRIHCFGAFTFSLRHSPAIQPNSVIFTSHETIGKINTSSVHLLCSNSTLTRP